MTMYKHAAENSASSKSTWDKFVFQKGGSQKSSDPDGQIAACDGRKP